MYHRRLEFNVTAGRLAAFEEGQTTVGELRKKQKGFIGQAVLQSYGYPGKYAVTIRWENWEAADAFARSKAFRDMIEANPREGRGFAPSRPTEAYASVLDISADGFSGTTGGEYQCEVLADWVIDRGPAGAALFERVFAELGELRKKHMQGFGSRRLRRSLGSPFKYLSIDICTDLDAALKAWEPAQLQRWAKDHPISEITGIAPAVDTYRVVQRMTP